MYVYIWMYITPAILVEYTKAKAFEAENLSFIK